MGPSTNRSNTTVAQKPATANGTTAQQSSASATTEPTVNRKKQKRRQKQAAKLAAEKDAAVGPTSLAPKQNGRSSPYDQFGTQDTSGDLDYDESEPEDNSVSRDNEELFYSEEDGDFADDTALATTNGKSKKKKKNKPRADSNQDYQSPYSNQHYNPPPPPPPPLNNLNSISRVSHKVAGDRIWNTSTAEERERIKEFWLSLEESDRKSLVKIEKEAVLKKMKEQQKHSCSCSVCGRKRTAIEEELEVLYDAYYEELEQYANHQQLSLGDGTPIIPPPGPYSLKPPPRRDPTGNRPPHPNKMVGTFVDEEEDDEVDYEVYSDEDDSEDDYNPPEPSKGPHTRDLFNFGNSLTVQGGILTVADDLLKNDGKKFIEMMEQLAERRMQREEEAQYAAAGLKLPSMQEHNHPRDDSFDEDDEDYASDDEDYDDEDDMEQMTEEQRMEEGRRMFQIFAARMFEQRVLTAYREKVAHERQERLLEQLADESRLDAEKEARKQKQSQKKKEKKRQQKAVKEEEKLKRDAEKAAEDAQIREAEEKRLEEIRQKKDEQRKKKDAEKKAQDEERFRKEAEKQRRAQEEREQRAESERKQRENKEKEKRRKEEAKRKEREEREAREKEAKDKKERENAERRERELKIRVEREAKDRAKKEELARQPVPVPTLMKRPPPAAVPIPPGLQPSTSAHASPHPQIATPVINKVPIPARPRQSSHQGSHQSSPKSAQMPPGSITTSPSNSVPQLPLTSATVSKVPLPLPLPLSLGQQAPVMTSHAPMAPPPGMSGYPPYAGSPIMPSPAFPSHYTPAIPGMMPRVPPGHESTHYSHQPMSAPPYRNFASPTMQFPPGINNNMRPANQIAPVTTPASQVPIGSGVGVTSTHSRQTSASYDKPPFGEPATHAHPIARPAPIQRPLSNPQQDGQKEMDDLSSHLGSSALLDDTDDTLGGAQTDGRGGVPPGGPRPTRLAFGGSPMFSDPLGSSKMENFPRGVQSGNAWGAPPLPFGTPTIPSTWSASPGWSNNNNAFGVIGGPHRPQSRPVAIRLLACQSCTQLSSMSPNGNNNFHPLQDVLRVIDKLKPVTEPPIAIGELLDICETEGNAQNGGGHFSIQNDGTRGLFVRFEPVSGGNGGRPSGAPGEIGSPLVSHAVPFGGGRGYQTPGPGIPTPSGF